MSVFGDAPPLSWERLLEAGEIDERLVATSVEEARGASSQPAPVELAPGLREAVRRAGIEGLYSHQVEALDASRAGDLIVTSGTASGKSLSFNLPVLDAIARDPKARALYVYPTKALAQDQARKLSQLGPPELRHAIYDGDTPRDDRPAIRRRSNLVLTNPDMLNMGLLAHHKGWGDFLANLEWIVVDEAHTYRGVFGSHVANVLRRLRRVARVYGSSPRFILASATIANPVELAERLVGTDFELVDSDGAPRAKRRIAVWNPPVLDERTMRRRSVLSEAAELLADLVVNGARTICFLRSRRGIELILRFTRMRLTELGEPALARRIAPYRAGYTPQQRREIEAQLAAGELLAVVATDALELGIDIGELDAAVCVTFPGTVASLRQMWGRAGRRSEGIALYVAGEDALDQFFCRHPDEFLARPVEAAILDHANERIQTAHVLAAAHEAPLGGAGAQPGATDDEILGARWRERAEALVGAGRLRRARDGRYLPRGAGFPAGEISLRSASPDSVAVVEGASGEVIGTVEAERAFSTVHPGAIYLHLGRSYEVRELDVDGRRAIVDAFDGDWYTQPRKETEVFIESVGAQRSIGAAQSGVELRFGEVSVTEQVIAYQRKSLADHSVIDLVGLELPEQNFPTQALWYLLADQLAGPDALAPEVLLGALHASEHSQIAVLPLLAMCDRWDIGGLSTNIHFQTGLPTIFVYDGHPGGVGIARRGYDEFERLVGDAARLVGECPCEAGCPSCIQSPKCGNLNEPLHKAGALELMDAIINLIAAERRPGRTAA
ncbi:MAG: DEAD/DEAH box helicase [Solirubrobacterales bacterium]|nr:DEAD/DEAH box helicase [Solirubrobacterales bacterium]